MLHRVFGFADLTAGQVMVPRTELVAIPVDISMADLASIMARYHHSRYPVYDGTLDNLVGILWPKDVAVVFAESGAGSPNVRQLMRPAMFVPETMHADRLLTEMRRNGRHEAIVIDEFGGMSGVLTLEDLLQKIVGDIREEHDAEAPPIVDQGDGRLVVDASVPIADLSCYLGATLPSDGDYHSLGGFIIAQLGRVPEVGTQLTAHGMQFDVREADERKVSKVEITRLAPPESLMPRSASRITAA